MGKSQHISRKIIGEPFSDEDVARFEKFISPEPNTGCFLWTGAANKRGYGYFWSKGCAWNAHRFAYAAAHGGVPRTAHVLHKCDNSYCMNPDHLELGTHAQNMADAKRRGRMATGERCGTSKLRASDVVAIRQSTESKHVLAARYSISPDHVNRLRRGHGWEGCNA